MKKIVLSNKGKEHLPGYLKVVMKQFMVKKVWWPDGHPPLESVQGDGIHYTPEDQPEYVNYCKKRLKQGKIDSGQAKSMMVGLNGCGSDGKELSEAIKREVLRR